MNPIHIYRTILSAAGEQAPVLKRCLRDSVIAASLQGASFALLVPICLALGAGNNRAAVLWLLAALMVACIRFAEPLGQILSMSSIYSMVQQGYARLQELLAVAPLELVGEAAAPTRHDITFENVHYHYDANPEPVLRGINLHIPERALTALVGHSGCGKTTLIRLIMRYADPQQGRVLIGGSDIRALTQQELMRKSRSSSRTCTSLTTPSATTSASAKLTPQMRKSKPPPAPHVATTSSWQCRRATKPASAISAANFPAANASTSPSPAPSCKTVRC